MSDAYSQLFSPFDLGPLSLKNRVVMAPMSTSLGGTDGAVTADQIAFYQERARGGFGLVIVEFTCVDPATGRTELRQLSLESRKNLEGHVRLVDALHNSGTKAFIQLQHGGRFAPAKLLPGGITKGPSQVVSRRDPAKVVVQELTADEIRFLVEAYGSAAGRAAEAGYDGIELHGAHGYLLSQFMSPVSNHRDDEWGGDAERRLSFPLAVTKAVRAAIGDLPFCYRISADEFIPGGLTIDDNEQICRRLVDGGVDILHASTGRGPEAFDKVMEPMSAPEGWRLPYARRLREATGVPVIGVGQIRTPQTAEEALRNGDCDLIALGRPSLTDPEWPNKARAGRSDLIRPCTTCNFCISEENLHRICCAENPRAGRELDAMIPTDLGHGRTAVVVGAGPGGMTAALMLSAAGFETRLYETRTAPGGGLVASGTPPGKDFLLRYRDYLVRRLNESTVMQHCGQAVGIAELTALRPDVTIVATGTRPRHHPIERLDTAMVVEAFDLLMGDVADPFGEGDHVVVYGGGETGCETAEYAAAKGARVTLVTRSRRDQLARSAELVYRTNLVRRLDMHERVTILENHHVIAATNGSVTVVGPAGDHRRVEAKCVLLAQGREPDRDLADALVADGLSVHLVGDGRKGGRIGDAVNDSYLAMRAIVARYQSTTPIAC